MAEELGYSFSLLKKWRKRLAEVDPEDDTVLFSRSRAPCHHHTWVGEEVERKLLEIRDRPPANRGRVPVPVTMR